VGRKREEGGSDPHFYPEKDFSYTLRFSFSAKHHLTYSGIFGWSSTSSPHTDTIANLNLNPNPKPKPKLNTIIIKFFNVIKLS